MTAVNVPRANPAVTPSSARTACLPDPYTFDTASRRTAQLDLMPSEARHGGDQDRYPAPPHPWYSGL
ncbi:hypothetical protein GCM10009827_010040 [Dactylosporangium maewongense]|uniref:Uncharacterized protein n=1 Tax=Dactylosporangium maewongense TaxID=634393 RepID=A0ABP4KH64_9ACTN